MKWTTSQIYSWIWNEIIYQGLWLAHVKQQWDPCLRQSYMGSSLLQLRNAQRKIKRPIYFCCHRHVHKCELCLLLLLPAPKMCVVHRSMTTTEERRDVCLVTSFPVLMGNTIFCLKYTRVLWSWISYERGSLLIFRKEGWLEKKIDLHFFKKNIDIFVICQDKMPFPFFVSSSKSIFCETHFNCLYALR